MELPITFSLVNVLICIFALLKIRKDDEIQFTLQRLKSLIWVCLVFALLILANELLVKSRLKEANYFGISGHLILFVFALMLSIQK